MELLKKEIQTSVVKAVKHMQITLDKDMNVPDSKPDMEKIIQNRGEIRLEEIEIMNERIRVKGVLLYKGLYLTAEAGPIVHSLSYPFELEEYINADGMKAADSVKVTAELDDLNVIMIHSRKLGIRALITYHAVINEGKAVEGAVKAIGEQVEQKFQEISLTQLVFHKRDTSRIKGEMTLAASKPNIREVIWEEGVLRSPEIRLMDGRVQVRGEMVVFFLYLGEEEHVPVQYLEWEVPFTAEIPCPECREGMVGNIHLNASSCQLEVKPDADGEERIVTMEAILNLDMKGYEEEKTSFLEDVYRVNCEVTPNYSPFSYENLIIKNNAKTKVAKRFRFDDKKVRVLQLIHVDGSVKIDEMERREDGIYVEGVVMADLLMITDEDRNPLYGMTEILPFSYLVEAKDLKEKDNYEMEAFVDQIHGIMLDGDEVEIKAVISLDTIAFSQKEGRVMTDVTEQPYDYEKMKSIPGIAIYIAPKAEPVWNVAKAYGASLAEVKRMNQLESEMLKPGQKIFLVKKVKELL